MSAIIAFRVPKKHKETCETMARNLHVSVSVIYRQALEKFMSEHSTIPTTIELHTAVQRLEVRVDKMEKAMIRKELL